MPTVSSSKAQEGYPTLLDDYELCASLDSENSASPTSAANIELIDESIDQDVEQDALGMQDHVIEKSMKVTRLKARKKVSKKNIFRMTIKIFL